MKYLVMECHPGYAVVLGGDGRFLKVANLHYEVGQTVTDVTEVTLPQRQPVSARRPGWVTQLGAMAACLVLVAAAALGYMQMPYASVYMTINPQVRIDVNRADRVLDVEGMNPDGAYLLHGYDPDRKALDTVMDELVDRAIDTGYLHEGGRITLELDGRESWVNSHSDHLNTHLTEYLTDRITVTVDVQKPQTQQTGPVSGTPAAPTAPAAPIVIPVTPDAYEDSGYDGSDYGDSDYGDSGYDGSDYGDSGYDGSDYDDSGYAGSGSAASDYEDAASDYEADSIYEADSPYGSADSGYSGGGSQESDYSDYGSAAQGSTGGGNVSSSGASAAPAPAPDSGSDYDDGSDYGDSDYDD